MSLLTCMGVCVCVCVCVCARARVCACVCVCVGGEGGRGGGEMGVSMLLSASSPVLKLSNVTVKWYQIICISYLLPLL